MPQDVDQNALAGLEADILSEIAAAAALKELEAVRVSALGKKGRISGLMQQLGKMAPDERRSFGQTVNALKGRVSDALEAQKARLERAELEARLASESADVTLPVRLGPLADGRIHPLSQVFDEVNEIFADMGFAVAEGPDIDTDDNCFTKLNIPAHHPARQDMDTFYLRERSDGTRMVLRPHTSPVQIRTMLAQQPPIRIIAPGRVYRCDSDQTHTPMFHQVEGLVIDEETHLGHLKWCLEEFCKAFFEVDEVIDAVPCVALPVHRAVDGGGYRCGRDRQARRVAGDPGVRHGASQCACQLRSGSGALPGLCVRHGPRPYCTMLKYGIPDLRDMFAGDLRWMRHYGFMPLDVPTLAGGMSS